MKFDSNINIYITLIPYVKQKLIQISYESGSFLRLIKLNVRKIGFCLIYSFIIFACYPYIRKSKNMLYITLR